MDKQTKKGKVFRQQYEAFIKSGRTYVGLVAVLQDADLSCQARILFHIISSLCYVEGYCYATNETLTDRLGLKKTMIKQYIRELETNGIIECKVVPCNYGKRREIYINFESLHTRYRR